MLGNTCGYTGGKFKFLAVYIGHGRYTMVWYCPQFCLLDRGVALNCTMANATRVAFWIVCALIVAVVGFTLFTSPVSLTKSSTPPPSPVLGQLQLDAPFGPTQVTAASRANTGFTAVPNTNSKLTRVRSTTTKPTATPNPSINPGCIKRSRLGEYKPVDTGTVYDHPSLIQYAKLAKSKTVAAVSLTFMEYVALLSAHKFLKPDKILIHTYTNITGKYWDMVQKWDTPVVIRKNERVVKLGKRTMSPDLMTHHADFIKIRGLYELGGTISDFDVIIVNGTKWKEMQKKAECLLSQQEAIVNAGFNSCIMNSSFVRRWLDGYYTDYRRDWLYNASNRPTSILINKKDPVCYNMHLVDNIATHPKWSQWKEWLEADSVKWREKIAAHYFNKELKNYNESAVQANNSFGELLRYVMET